VVPEQKLRSKNENSDRVKTSSIKGRNVLPLMEMELSG
jgi:hypothetical protein